MLEQPYETIHRLIHNRPPSCCNDTIESNLPVSNIRYNYHLFTQNKMVRATVAFSLYMYCATKRYKCNLQRNTRTHLTTCKGVFVKSKHKYNWIEKVTFPACIHVSHLMNAISKQSKDCSCVSFNFLWSISVDHTTNSGKKGCLKPRFYFQFWLFKCRLLFDYNGIKANPADSVNQCSH